MSNLSDLKRRGADYSTTEKFVDWVGNADWRTGYKELVNGDESTNGYGEMWKTLSAMVETPGSKIYDKITNYISNISDIDTCELHALKSYAEMIGYNTTTQYLDYDFPIEVYELLNIFSIKKDYLLKSDKVLLLDSRQKMFEATKTTDSQHTDVFNFLMCGYDLSAFSEVEQSYIEQVKNDPILYTMSTDDDIYVEYIDSCFEELLLNNVFLKYREYELGITPSPTSELSATFDPITESNNSPYIWKSILQELDSSNLFRYDNSDDEDIINAKIKYNIPQWFPEKRYVDEIQMGLKDIDRFITTERIIIDLEFERRKNERDNQLGVSRYFIDREEKVKSYFKFLELFNNQSAALTKNAEKYEPVDSTKFVITDDIHGIITNNEVNVDDIKRCAVRLRNIALKISYLRESLKLQAQRYYMNGSELILKDLLNDYFNRYVFNTEEFWRYNLDYDYNTFPQVIKNIDFDIDIIEYTDITEYLNISAQGDPVPNTETNKLHPRYWDVESDVELSFTQPEIDEFYENDIGLQFDVVNNGVSGYNDTLKSFLDIVYNSAAVSATSETITTTDTVSSIIDTGIYYVNKSDLTVSGDVNTTTISDDLFNENFTDYTTGSNSVDNEFWSLDNANSIGIVTDGSAGQVLRITPTTSTGGVGRLPLNATSLNTPLVDLGDYLLEVTYRKTINTTETNPSFFRIYNGTTFVNTPTITFEMDTYTTTTTKFTVSNSGACYIDVFDMDTSFPIYVKSIKIFNISDDVSTELDATYFLDTDSLTLSTVTVTSAVERDIDGIGLYNKYIGLSGGDHPYANIKNQYHPSYQIHPYMKNFYELINDDNPLKNVFEYYTQGYTTDYDTINNRIDEYGNLINVWWNENVDFSGYQTSYENSKNLDDTSTKNSLIDMDDPFDYDCLCDLYTYPTTFMSCIANASGDMYYKYYSHLNLTTSELTIINKQLQHITNNIDGDSLLTKVSTKIIYKYFKDQYGNSYTLYKDENTIDAVGEIWMRKKDHPLSFPLFVYDDNIDNKRDETLSQIPYGVHITLANTLDNFDVYDMVFDKYWIYIVYKNDTDTQSVMFGGIDSIIKIDGNDQYIVYKFDKDFNHNNEIMSPSSSVDNTYYQYVGVYSSGTSVVGVFVKLFNDGSLKDIPEDYTHQYKRSEVTLRFMSFTSTTGVLDTSDVNVGVMYGVNTNTDNRSSWKLSSDGDYVSIVFESIKIPTPDIVRNFAQTSQNENGEIVYDDMVTYDCRPELYQSGLTVIDFDLLNNVKPLNSECDVSYFYRNSDITYHPLYPGHRGKSNMYLNAFTGQTEFKIQFFGEPVGTMSDSFVYEDVTPPITSPSAFQSMTNTVNPDDNIIYHKLEGDEIGVNYLWEGEVTTQLGSGNKDQLFDMIGSFNYDELHVLEETPNDDEYDYFDLLTGDITSQTTFGEFEVLSGVVINCYYSMSGEIVQDFTFNSGSESVTIYEDGNTDILQVINGDYVDTFNITLINKDEAKFSVVIDDSSTHRKMDENRAESNMVILKVYDDNYKVVE